MFLLRRLPPCLALLLLGALSLRLGLPFVAAVPLTLALLVLPFLRSATAQLLLAVVLWVGVLAWAGTAWWRVSERLAGGQPWLRLALIFAGVALFTAWAAWQQRPKAGPPSVQAGRGCLGDFLVK